MRTLQGGEVKPAHPTSRMHQYADKTRYREWSDGSYRRDPIKVRGKAYVKAAKRALARRQVTL